MGAGLPWMPMPGVMGNVAMSRPFSWMLRIFSLSPRGGSYPQSGRRGATIPGLFAGLRPEVSTQCKVQVEAVLEALVFQTNDGGACVGCAALGFEHI